MDKCHDILTLCVPCIVSNYVNKTNKLQVSSWKISYTTDSCLTFSSLQVT